MDGIGLAICALVVVCSAAVIIYAEWTHWDARRRHDRQDDLRSWKTIIDRHPW